jgi:hypothetical protein
MENAHIQLEDFSVENNSLTFNSNMINEIAEAIVNKLGDVKTTERRNDVVMDFEENVEKTTVEEAEVKATEGETVTEEMSKESVAEETPEVVDRFDEDPGAEAEEEEEIEEETEEPAGNGNGQVEEDPPTDEEIAEDVSDLIDALTEESTEDEVSAAREAYDNLTDDQKGYISGDMVSKLVDAEERIEAAKEAKRAEDEETAIISSGDESPKRKFALNGMEFEVSLSEIQWALYELVNNTYAESDNDYYSVEVYEGSKTVVMSGLFSGRSYKQGYKVRNEVYSLVGDRISVKPVFVTADEEAELDRMRSNYSAISEKLQKYESEPQKMEILNSSDYANIADQADFAELKKQENHFDLTIDEVKDRADSMLLQYAKSGKLNFSVVEQEKKEEPKKDFFAFARINDKSDFLDGLLKSRNKN